jgi:hypothetical protein
MTGRVVVALTTIPSRQAFLLPTLMSLAHQSIQIDVVYVSAPLWSRREECAYDHEALRTLVEPARAFGLDVVVVVSAADYGPGTKVLGCIDLVDDDDVVVLVDDDNVYADFSIEALVHTVRSQDCAASFFTFLHDGIRMGQGADGFALPGRFMSTVRGHIPLIRDHQWLRFQDDVWISFLLACEAIPVADLSHALEARGLERCYTSAHEINGLMNLQGDLQRDRLNRRCTDELFSQPWAPARMKVSRRTFRIKRAVAHYQWAGKRRIATLWRSTTGR